MLNSGKQLNAHRNRTGHKNLAQFSMHSTNFIIYLIDCRSPTAEDQWQRYKAGDAHVHDIVADGATNLHSASKETAFWLQYLPQLFNLLTSSERTEQLTADKGNQVTSTF